MLPGLAAAPLPGLLEMAGLKRGGGAHKSYVQAKVWSPSRKAYKLKLLVNVEAHPKFKHKDVAKTLLQKAEAFKGMPFDELRTKLISLRDKIIAGK